MPRSNSASAAVSPPMPAPTTITFLGVLMGRTRQSDVPSRRPSALERGRQPRSPRKRCSGPGDKSAHDVADRENFIDAPRGLACREQTRVWTACLGRGDDLIPQAIAIAPRRIALGTPLIDEGRVERTQNRMEPAPPRTTAAAISN